ALEGGTSPLAEGTFSFRVVPPEEAGTVARGEAGSDGAPWSVALIDDGGLSGAAVSVAEASGAEGRAGVRPNPAVGRAAVAFALEAPSEVRLALYDVLGRAVLVLDAGRLEAGPHRLDLDLSALPAGVYVWRLDAGGQMQTGRLTVAR